MEGMVNWPWITNGLRSGEANLYNDKFVIILWWNQCSNVMAMMFWWN